jgi:hypothetical protein
MLTVLTGALLGACGGTDRGPASQPRAERPGAERRIITVGQVGQLPPVAQRQGAPKLMLPRQIIPVPGSFPLGSTVRFQVPIRNDGDRTLRIAKLEPG